MRKRFGRSFAFYHSQSLWFIWFTHFFQWFYCMVQLLRLLTLKRLFLIMVFDYDTHFFFTIMAVTLFTPLITYFSSIINPFLQWILTYENHAVEFHVTNNINLRCNYSLTCDLSHTY